MGPQLHNDGELQRTEYATQEEIGWARSLSQSVEEFDPWASQSMFLVSRDSADAGIVAAARLLVPDENVPNKTMSDASRILKMPYTSVVSWFDMSLGVRPETAVDWALLSFAHNTSGSRRGHHADALFRVGLILGLALMDHRITHYTACNEYTFHQAITRRFGLPFAALTDSDGDPVELDYFAIGAPKSARTIPSALPLSTAPELMRRPTTNHHLRTVVDLRTTFPSLATRWGAQSRATDG